MLALSILSSSVAASGSAELKRPSPSKRAKMPLAGWPLRRYSKPIRDRSGTKVHSIAAAMPGISTSAKAAATALIPACHRAAPMPDPSYSAGLNSISIRIGISTPIAGAPKFIPNSVRSITPVTVNPATVMSGKSGEGPN